jgi:hypothetical protein
LLPRRSIGERNRFAALPLMEHERTSFFPVAWIARAPWLEARIRCNFLLLLFGVLYSLRNQPMLFPRGATLRWMVVAIEALLLPVELIVHVL